MNCYQVQQFQMKKHSKSDPRVIEVRKHLLKLSKKLTRPIAENDYLDYRSKHANHLPSIATVSSLFGSWDEALIAAGLDPNKSSEDLDRLTDEELIQAIHDASEGLGCVPSTHAYDRWRGEYIASGERWRSRENPPSSSVIRKWLGFWDDALERAGLESKRRPARRRASTAEIIAALDRAKKQVDGMLSINAYEDLAATRAGEGLPSVEDILVCFSDWDMALRTADVEQSDSLHPQGLWTAEECRRIAKQAEVVLGEPLTRQNYRIIVKKSNTPKPSWPVLQELLRQ